MKSTVLRPFDRRRSERSQQGPHLNVVRVWISFHQGESYLTRSNVGLLNEEVALAKVAQPVSLGVTGMVNRFTTLGLQSFQRKFAILVFTMVGHWAVLQPGISSRWR